MYKIKIFVRALSFKFESYVKLYGYNNQSWIFVSREKAYNLYAFFDIHLVNDILNFTILKAAENTPLSSVYFPEIIPYKISAIIQKEKIEKNSKIILKREEDIWEI